MKLTQTYTHYRYLIFFTLRHLLPLYSTYQLIYVQMHSVKDVFIRPQITIGQTMFCTCRLGSRREAANLRTVVNTTTRHEPVNIRTHRYQIVHNMITTTVITIRAL